LLIGGAFCLASFLTYTAIGLGLLRALHMLAAFNSIRRGVELALVAVLVFLAVYSFRDAIRFRRSGHAHDVTLQLPDRLKRLTHRLMRTGLRGHAQVLSAFGVGAAVTALESVCTGQVYVPTLALVVKGGRDAGRGLAYLLVYNLMFILPLVIVFLLTYQGMKLTRLLEWSRQNVVTSKVLLGCFFIALAVAMALLR
jgi:cytochrome c biogenesis protein CcdA